MIRPEDVLLLGVALLAVLFFIGGAIDVFGVPVNPRHRRRRKPARRWRMRNRPGLTELLEEWLEAESLLDTPAPQTVEKPKRVVAPTAPVVRGAPMTAMTPTFSWSRAPSRESLEHAGSGSGPADTPAVFSSQPATGSRCAELPSPDVPGQRSLPGPDPRHLPVQRRWDAAGSTTPRAGGFEPGPAGESAGGPRGVRGCRPEVSGGG